MTLEEWTKILDEGEPIDTIYFDFAKAYDTVAHRRLVRKLEAYGIKGNVQKWIENFLTQRKQRTRVNNEISEWIRVKSGIPQGTCIGPILFLIFINDAPSVLSNVCKIFADDTKVFGKCLTNEQRFSIQQDINKLNQWSNKWQLRFNEDKCKVLHLGGEKNPKQVYKLGEKLIQSVAEEKDLGIIVDDSINFHKQASTAAMKANRKFGLIKRTFEHLSQETMPLLYKSLIRPIIDYGSVLWNVSRYAGDDEMIEKVQKRATKCIKGLENLPYEERLAKLNLHSLHYRRRRGDMIQVFKIVRGIDKCNIEEFFTLSKHSYGTRGHPLKISKPHLGNTKIRRTFFSNRVVNDWNSLPSEIVMSETLTTFKNRLDRHWKAFTFKTRERHFKLA